MGSQSISAAKSLSAPSAPSATLGAAPSPAIPPVDDVAVKLVGREKIFEREMNRIDQRTNERETAQAPAPFPPSNLKLLVRTRILFKDKI